MSKTNALAIGYRSLTLGYRVDTEWWMLEAAVRDAELMGRKFAIVRTLQTNGVGKKCVKCVELWGK